MRGRLVCIARCRRAQGDADVHRDAPFEADAGFLDGEPRLLGLSSSRFIDEEAVGDQPNGRGGQGTGFHTGCANVGGRDTDEITAKHQNQAANGRGRDPTAVGRWVCILVRHASDSETERRESSDWKPTTRLPCCQNATRPVAENKLPVSGIKRTTAPTRTGAVDGFAQKRGTDPLRDGRAAFRTTTGSGSVPLFVQSRRCPIKQEATTTR